MTTNNYQFVPFDFPTTQDGQFFCALDGAGILRSRREQLGLTMQQVAEMAGLQFSQYQRLESGERSLDGCSMKVGLSVCATLLLDPYEMVGISAKQKDPAELKPQTAIDNISEAVLPKKVGRKQIKRNIMLVYLNFRDYSIMVPYAVLDKLGSPNYIQILWNYDQRRIIIRPATETTEEAIDVPKEEFDDSLLSLTTFLTKNPIDAMGWGKTPHELEAELVRDNDDHIALLLDLKKAHPVEQINGCFITPSCLKWKDREN